MGMASLIRLLKTWFWQAENVIFLALAKPVKY